MKKFANKLIGMIVFPFITTKTERKRFRLARKWVRARNSNKFSAADRILAKYRKLCDM